MTGHGCCVSILPQCVMQSVSTVPSASSEQSISGKRHESRVLSALSPASVQSIHNTRLVNVGMKDKLDRRYIRHLHTSGLALLQYSPIVLIKRFRIEFS
jgi:hypothetical protein